MYGPRFSTAAGVRFPSQGTPMPLRPVGGPAAPVPLGRGAGRDALAAGSLGSAVAIAWPRPAEPRLLTNQLSAGREAVPLQARWRRAGVGRKRPNFLVAPAAGLAQLFRPSGGWIVSVPPF